LSFRLFGREINDEQIDHSGAREKGSGIIGDLEENGANDNTLKCKSAANIASETLEGWKSDNPQ